MAGSRGPVQGQSGSGLLPESFIQEVLARVEITEVVGRVVALKKSGSNFFGLCPFHGEKSPSFTVTPTKQFFHCFGCGKNGDAIGFQMEHGGLSFREAVTELAESVGMQMPATSNTNTAQDAARAESISKILKANELAASFFRHCLRHGETAKAYLRGRRVPSEAAKRFVLGYAPAGWQSLKEAFPDYAKNSVLVESGLVIENEEKRRYDRFRDRIMFGIRDPRGRLLGFGGRSLDNSTPKYLNSPETNLFNKSGALFGVYEARDGIRQTRRVIVTEGYMDAISMSMHGLPETVATMGTACTPMHIERLQALAPKTIFAFDGDAAGIKAAWRALHVCLPMAHDTHSFHFMLLPGGLDPDEVILGEGPEAMCARVDAAMSLSGFLLTQLAAHNNQLQTPEDRARFLSEGLEMIKRLPFGGNLYKILREELAKASRLSAADIAQLALQTAGAGARAATTRSSPWATLAQAASAQPASAAAHAEKAIETLPPEMQNAFFAKSFELFPAEERAFWTNLYTAVTSPGAADTEGDVCIAQRDLLANVKGVIEGERAKQNRDALRQAFRKGEAPEEALFVRPQMPE